MERLKDSNDNWVEGLDGVFRAILDHYSDVYKSEGWQNMQTCIQAIHNLTKPSINDALLAPVDEQEIQAAVFSVGALKAPSPNGLNGLFFQKKLGDYEERCCQGNPSILQYWPFTFDVNEMIVTLTAKILLPESINHLRPIGCCNFLYMVLSKILVLRMKSVMGEIVSPNQSAFVKGKLIQDNLAIAHEIFHVLKKKN